MIESFSPNKWKILSFALVGVILLGAAIPQANAAADISQIVQKIYDIVKDIQTKTNSEQTTLTTNLDVPVSTRASSSDLSSATSQILGASLPLREIEAQKSFNATDDSSLFTTINCNANYVVTAIRLEILVDDTDDHFKVVQLQDKLQQNPPNHYYIFDSIDSDLGLDEDLIQRVGIPISEPANQGLVFDIIQTETHGTANKLSERVMIMAPQTASCSVDIKGPSPAP
jgi:hypothetical protein